MHGLLHSLTDLKNPGIHTVENVRNILYITLHKFNNYTS